MTSPASQTTAQEPRHEHYLRLLEGMTRAVATKSYADITIADIVREAAVSRRSFYEHFATKADCLLALYESASKQALFVLSAAVDPTQPWRSQVNHALTAYLDVLALDQALLKTLFVEILGLGLPGLAVRRRVNEQLAMFIQIATATGENHRMSASMAMMIVGGINELILQKVEAGQSGELRSLVAPASQLIRAVAASESADA